MAKAELGTKRVCVACGAKFYDLLVSPAVCPKCGTEQPLDQPRPRRGGGNVVEDKRPKKAPAPGIDDEAADTETAEDDAEEDVLEDASDLEDDADSLDADIVVEPGEDEKDT